MGDYNLIRKYKNINIKFMSKVKPHLINKNEKYKIIGNFFEIISGLKSKNEIIDFFLGLLSASETLMIARRIQIAQMLISGDSYENIRKKLKVSNQTITKTDQWLHSGDEKYDIWLAKQLRKKVKISSKENKGSMLNKYAHHRFLKNLLS